VRHSTLKHLQCSILITVHVLNQARSLCRSRSACLSASLSHSLSRTHAPARSFLLSPPSLPLSLSLRRGRMQTPHLMSYKDRSLLHQLAIKEYRDMKQQPFTAQWDGNDDQCITQWTSDDQVQRQSTPILVREHILFSEHIAGNINGMEMTTMCQTMKKKSLSMTVHRTVAIYIHSSKKTHSSKRTNSK
jgi:hypothetical protein